MKLRALMVDTAVGGARNTRQGGQPGEASAQVGRSSA
jgi:hypothetical protein